MPITADAGTTPTAPAALDGLSIDTIRTLSMDGVQAANSGHPGTPMALAPLAYTLWTRHMRHDPGDPTWLDRDRFVLSAGHASMLLYSMLHLTGYDLPLEELKNFRQWGSRTPGHPEHGLTAGVETTTGPLGQGLGNGIGMALAERHLAARYNRPGHRVVDHHTYVICSDGDLMEGVASEAASLAGHLRLGKLICFWDDNGITIEGTTELAFSEDVLARFAAYGWHTVRVLDGEDLEALDAAIAEAKLDDRPSMIAVRTVIGHGSPGKAGSPEAHGSPLGAAEVAATKRNLGWPSEEAFHVPGEVRQGMGEVVARGAALHAEWQARWEAYKQAEPDLAAALQAALRGALPAGWDADLPVYGVTDKAIATRQASGQVLNAIAPRAPWLVGGSADLAPSTNTFMEGAGEFGPDSPEGRNLHWGVREHGMGAIMNGMALHGGVRPFGATFMVFSDYMRPSIRLASLMDQPTIYIFTHDSIGLGEDGPTHQPIEQLAALRAIPGLVDLRPADANETREAWRFAMGYRDGPLFMALTRQAVPHLDRGVLGAAEGLRKGAYVLADAEGGDPDVILIGTGSEVSLALDARAQLAQEGVRARVVSMPSWTLFARQPQEYRDSVLLPHVRARVAVEAASPFGWHQWVGTDGDIVGIPGFGASAPAAEVYRRYGITAAEVAARAQALLGLQQ
jgi:transketolase